MKLAFVIPLKSKHSSTNWNTTVALTLRCLDSIFNQTNKNFDVYISCNEFPYDSISEKLTIIKGNYPIPQSWNDGHEDKYRKIRRALFEVKKTAPVYVMKLDADDLVSRKLVNYVVNDKSDVYYINKGYIYADENFWIERSRRFHDLCGSSNILYCSDNQLPSDWKQNAKDFDILSCGHNIIESYFAGASKKIYSIPFMGAIYISGSGENHSRFDIRKLKSRKKLFFSICKRSLINNAIRYDFSLYPISDYLNMIANQQAPESTPLIYKSD